MNYHNSHNSNKLFQYIFLFIFLVSPLSSHAQVSPYGNRNSSDAADALSGKVGAYSPPAVYATKTTLNPIDASGKLSGTFTILNNDKDTIGDLRYRVELLEALPPSVENEFVEDTGRIYDSVLSPDVFALLSGEEKVVPFTYTPPMVPAGNYRLVIQITTSQGRDLGWDTAQVSLAGSTDAFVDLLPGTINLPEFPNEEIPSTSGPNVSPNTSFTLSALAKNNSDSAVTITPTLTVYDFATSGQVTSTTPGATITLEPKQELELAIPVTASATPGVYYGNLSLMSGTARVSPLAEYRWVVRGSSGHIISARIKDFFAKTGEAVAVAVEYTGSADAETTIKGTLQIEVTDTNGVAGTFTVPETLELTDGIGSGIAQVPLTRDIVGTPGLRVTLKAEDGTLLDLYEVAIPLNDEQLKTLLQKTQSVQDDAEAPKNKRIALYILIGSLLLGVFALVLHMHKKKHTATIPLGLFLVLSTLFTVTHGVLAAGNGVGIELFVPSDFQGQGAGWIANLENKPVIEVFINKPLHDAPVGTYSKNAVPFEYRIEYVACKNTIPRNDLLIRFDKNGEKHSNLTGSASSTWESLLSATFRNHSCPPGARYCVVSRSGNATLNLTALNPTALSATLQVGAFWAIDPDGWPAASWDADSVYIQHDRAHIINLWLNFIDPPIETPTPSITPTPFAQFSCTPQTQTVAINTNVTVSEDSFEGTFNANWNAPGAKTTTGSGTSFTTQYATPGEKIITATSTNFPGGTQTSTCRVQVTDSNSGANRPPVAVAKMSINGAPYSSTITVTQNEVVDVRLTAGEHGTPGSFDPDGWATAGKGVANGGKCQWNSDLNLGTATYETTITNPTFPTSCDTNLGPKNFTLTPGTYTYNLLQITDASGAVSSGGSVQFTVVADPDPTANKAPFAVAKMSINGGAYSSNVTVTQGESVAVRITAGEKGSAGSFDPNGWDAANKGVSTGGKIEWNNNLWLGEPKFEKTFTNPTAPSSADMDLGKKTFYLTPGTYTYNLLRITDAGGLISNIGAVTLTVKASPTTPTPPTPTPTGTFNPGDFEETR